jgi:3-hydroxyisobutyrate dehydrogenase-like beta-hydroxyacid dehydrogenase
MRIGFIGLGIMGSRMAVHLRGHADKLVVFNRTPEKAAPLLAAGAVWAASPAALATQVDVLFTMLAHPDAVGEVALGVHGFLDQLAPGALWVDCSTVHPAFAREMAAEARRRQIRFLDAPVAGSRPQAERAELVFLVGGDAADVEVCQPLLERMGQRVLHVGGHGMGTALKLVLNLQLALGMASFAEGLLLGQTLRLSRELLLQVLIGGPLTPPFVAMKREMLALDHYDADFPLEWMYKDLQMVHAAATDTALPLAQQARELYERAVHNGLGRLDFSAIARERRQEQLG